MLNTIALKAPRAAVAVARERLEQAAAALARGQTACEAARGRIHDLADQDGRRAAAYAAEVERAAADGTVPVPYLEVPAADAAERHRAQIEARGTKEAVERLTAAHAAAQVDVAAAERALREAVDQVLDAGVVGLMTDAERYLRNLEQIGAELAELLPDDRFEGAPGLPSEPAVRELLKHLPARPRSDIDVPVYELRNGGARVSRLAELRAALTSGTDQRAQAAA